MMCESTLVGVWVKEEAWFWLLVVLLWGFCEIKRLPLIKYMQNCLDATLGRFVFFKGRQWTGWRIPTRDALKWVQFQMLALLFCEDYTLRNVSSTVFKLENYERGVYKLSSTHRTRYCRSMKQGSVSHVACFSVRTPYTNKSIIYSFVIRKLQGCVYRLSSRRC
jgi:hypothetical protein